MTLLALATGNAILAWVAVAVALAGALAAIVLFTRVVRPALEIERYAQDILEAGLAIARNADGFEELRRTHELATAVPGLASEHLARHQRTDGP